jgi:hypothetical protein
MMTYTRAAQLIGKLLIWMWLLATFPANAESVTLVWNANTETNLIGYRVYAGTNSRSYHICIPTGLVTNQVIVLSEPGRWFFSVTATNNVSRESAYSDEVILEPKPQPPVLNSTLWVKILPVIDRSTNRISWQSITGAPTWLPATNGQEFFIMRQLNIERVNLLETP